MPIQRPGKGKGAAKMVRAIPKRHRAGGYRPTANRQAAHTQGRRIKSQHSESIHGPDENAVTQGASRVGLDRPGTSGPHVSARKERAEISHSDAIRDPQEKAAGASGRLGRILSRDWAENAQRNRLA